MKNKPILIVLGEPNSIFSELLFKVFKNKINKKINIIKKNKKKLTSNQNLFMFQPKLNREYQW